MDKQTLQAHPDEQNSGNDRSPSPPSNLKPHEATAFQFCARHDIRLEQEKVLQQYAVAALTSLITGSETSRKQ